MYIFTYNLQKSGKRFPRKICHCYSYCLHVEKHPPKDVASNNKFAYSSVTGHNSILEVRIRKKIVHSDSLKHVKTLNEGRKESCLFLVISG